MAENTKISLKTKKTLIGLTGKYCAGKNHVAKLLEQRALPVLDVDKLGHKVIEMEKMRILNRFGEDVLQHDGKIDRKLLGQKVFGKPEELSELEDIIHPGVNNETLAWIDGQTEKACIVNAALLHKSSAFELLDAVIIVEAPFFVRLLRAKNRDHLPWISLFKRFQSQKEWNNLFNNIYNNLYNYQLLKEKTDIYRVENSAYFRLGKKSAGNKLEQRINEILSEIFPVGK